MTVAGKTTFQRYVECSVLGAESTVDAEDSSYDSDYEAEESIGSNSGHPQLESQISTTSHPEVSRTTSDTLAAEFAEYVTVQGTTPTHAPGYMARVEFALKLGYTERLVQTALQKLGPDPGQNELLAELIKLGASTSQLGEDVEESDLVAEGELLVDDGGGCDNGGGESNDNNCSGGLRPVVIDGSNVAMSHGNKEIFSCRGIKICVDWFRARGHKEITVFVPKWRKEASRIDNPIADQEILGELERDRLLVFTPSRLVGGKRMVCYDDRYILRLAAEVDGIVVSNDNYRDLAQESPEFRKVVEERILMYSFVNDRFMPPDDPLGRSGPTLENFLRIGHGKTDPPRLCPYAKKCTYGNKCKFRHPERGPHPQKSVTERLVEHAQKHLQARGPSLSLPLPGTVGGQSSSHQSCHKPLCKSRSATSTYNVGTASAVFCSGTRSNGSGARNHHILSTTKRKPIDSMADESVHEQQQQHGPSLNPQGYHSSGWQPVRSNNPEPEPANMHRKLQRQLTLNPVCDPRLHYLKRHNSHPNATLSSGASSSHQQANMALPQHRPQTSWDDIENKFEGATMMRYPWIAAAGPLSGSATTVGPAAGGTLASMSDTVADPRVPVLPSGAGPVMDCGSLTAKREQEHRFNCPDPRMHWVLGSVLSGMPDEVLKMFYDLRVRMYADLINIFPEEQVRVAMMQYPFEVEAEEICSTLLKMRRRHR